MKKRAKVGIVIDYSIRIPNFKDCYTKCKAEILSGAMSQENESDVVKSSKDLTGRDFWISLHKNNPEEYLFYETALAPQEDYGDTFDYTLKKYFANNEHRLKFLDDWSYNLFGQGSVTNPADIKLINICQSKLADVVLIDRTTHTRKIPNTMAFLSRAQLFIKGVEFVNKIEELEEMKTSKEFLDVYDAVANPKLALTPPLKTNEQSETFLNWLVNVEKLINK